MGRGNLPLSTHQDQSSTKAHYLLRVVTGTREVGHQHPISDRICRPEDGGKPFILPWNDISIAIANTKAVEIDAYLRRSSQVCFVSIDTLPELPLQRCIYLQTMKGLLLYIFFSVDQAVLRCLRAV